MRKLGTEMAHRVPRGQGDLRSVGGKQMKKRKLSRPVYVSHFTGHGSHMWTLDCQCNLVDQGKAPMC